MKNYYLHEVHLFAVISEQDKYFREVYITNNEAINFISTDKNVVVKSVNTTLIDPVALPHLIRYLGSVDEPQGNYIEVNGYELDDEDDIINALK